MAKLNLKKAKFYCESCGSEVPQNAKFCGTCGKFFTFVRCPNCQHTGDSKLFTNGCPNCGYAVKKNNNFSSAFDSNNNKKTGSIFSNIFSTKKDSTSKTEDSSLPIWIYLITVAALIAVVLGIYSCL